MTPVQLEWQADELHLGDGSAPDPTRLELKGRICIDNCYYWTDRLGLAVLDGQYKDPDTGWEDVWYGYCGNQSYKGSQADVMRQMVAHVMQNPAFASARVEVAA